MRAQPERDESLPRDAAESSSREARAERRHIRSFVLRQGRFTPAQQRAFAEHWARYGLDPRQPLDPEKAFGRRAPLVLEIGFGNGEQLLWSAQHESVRDFIGIEVHRPGVGRLMNALAVDDVHNVRLYNHDAVEVLRGALGAVQVDEVRVYFPDPWPKKRQQKRRLIQADFVALLAARVRSGGVLHLATDWQDYAEQMLAVMDSAPGWCNRAGAGNYSPRPPTRIATHFEKRGVRLGHGVWDLVYTKE